MKLKTFCSQVESIFYRVLDECHASGCAAVYAKVAQYSSFAYKRIRDVKVNSTNIFHTCTHAPRTTRARARARTCTNIRVLTLPKLDWLSEVIPGL
jgi:hypothetical protein